ncbi:MAG: hypothetical protein ACKO58_04930 [Cyanobium sp.]
MGSLCREAGSLRARVLQLQADLLRCQEGGLRRRLKAERVELSARCLELHKTVRELGRHGGFRDPISLAFLSELAHRAMAP